MLNLQEGNLAFKYRYLPRFYHRDELVEKHQDFGDPRAAIVTTREEYQGTSFTWTIFAHKDENGARMDIILFRMEAKPGFGHARSSVYLQELGEASDPPETVRPASSAYALPVGTPPDSRAHCFVYAGLPGRNPPGKADASGGDVWEAPLRWFYRGTIDPKAFTLDYAKKSVEATAAYWREVRRFKTPFIFLSRRSRDAGRVRTEYLTGAGNRGGYLRVPCSPTIYRGLWVVDGYYFGECAYMMGRDEEGLSVPAGGAQAGKTRRVHPDPAGPP